MTTFVSRAPRLSRGGLGLGLGALMLAFGGFSQALADDAAPAAADQAAPAAGADAAKPADASKPAASNWVKICDKLKFADPAAKDPKTAPPLEKQVCITQQERIDPNSGSLLVSAAVRDVEGSDKKGLLITVPLGMVIPAGLGLFFDEEKDDKKIVKLPFDACLPSGCTAQGEATAEIIDQMGKAKVMNVVAISMQGAQVGFKVPLNGFAPALAGKPIDTAKYVNARKMFFMQLRERLIARQQAVQAATQAAIKGAQDNAAADPNKDAGSGAPADPNAKATGN